ncbi:MAG: RNA polymerase sigma factor [Elusimicrobia bacterium]|nr:RNA polymerase sigma factor [Elusimicrobiota bacterium]
MSESAPETFSSPRGSKRIELKFSENQIIERAIDRDEEAMGYIYEEYSPLVWSLALRYTGNQSLAEDASAAVFIRLFKNLHKFRGESAFKTWLYRLSINTIINYGRREKKFRAGELFENHLGEGDKTEEIEARDLVQRLLKKLPRRDEKLIIMREMEGMTYQEIANISNLKLSTVKTRIFRARLKLRKLYEEEV